MDSRQEYSLEPISNRPVSPVSPLSTSIEDHRAPGLQPEHGREHEDTNQHDEVPGYEESAGAAHNTDVPPSYQRRDPAVSTPLRGNFFIWVPTAIYVTIVVWSWVTICVIAREPPLGFDKDLRTRQYHAARVLQSVANVATIPIISAVCACAAAIYVQNQRNEHSLSLRQVMALADREWMNPLSLITPASKRFASAFLSLAIFIYVMGAITYPIQGLFVQTEEKPVNVRTVRPVSYPDLSGYHINVPVGQISNFYGKGYAINILRKQLEAGYLAGQQAELWGSATKLGAYDSQNSWYTELPAGYDTGTQRSIAPRYNSSTSCTLVPVDEFPSNCSSVPYYFYASLNYTRPSNDTDPEDDIEPVQIQVCMPANMTASPWSASNARQEITESLYIHVNTSYAIVHKGNGTLNNTYRVTMNTTAGWFELPNMWNKGTPGPILENPNATCETSAGCIDRSDPVMAAGVTFWDYYKRSGDDELGDGLTASKNFLGPLGTIAVSIFGPGSWFDTQQQLFPNYPDSNETGWLSYLDTAAERNFYFPLVTLTNDDYDDGYWGYYTGIPVYEWLGFFIMDGHNTSFPQALTRASFFAIKAMLLTDEYDRYNVYSVIKNDFETVVMPSMSLAGMIVVSVLMALYLIPLLVLALYAGLSKSWTTRLDSFVMLRMGAAIGQRDLPMQIGKSLDKIAILDDLPGVVRDVSAPDDKIRQIALGIGGTQLRTKAKYPAYPGNDYEQYGVIWY